MPRARIRPAAGRRPGRPVTATAPGRRRRSPQGHEDRKACRGRHARLQPQVRKVKTMSIATNKALTTALALSLGLATGACGANSAPNNGSLDSVNQPVVERTNYTLDLAGERDRAAGAASRRRLAGWFELAGSRLRRPRLDRRSAGQRRRPRRRRQRWPAVTACCSATAHRSRRAMSIRAMSASSSPAATPTCPICPDW